ncbi:lysostaphin resistance A-like protein [Robertmurraya beringensis]|uniref:Lysostaphin resistance A-like protein n=1 Tax=Robertmurraya beringensis TaxID=641660 RepID=A0ABV6KQF3_9BACI
MLPVVSHEVDDNKINVKILIGFLFSFYVVWTLKELWFVQFIYLFEGATTSLLNGSIKVFVWAVPVCIIIKFQLNSNPFTYLKLNVNVKKGLLLGIGSSFLMGLYLVINTMINKELPSSFSLTFNEVLNTVLLAGLLEELMFRGFILQEIHKRLDFWKSNMLTALLFVAIHYPVWIRLGTFFHFETHLYIFLVGLLFGYVYKRTGSLWAAIILHSAHNFFLAILL